MPRAPAKLAGTREAIGRGRRRERAWSRPAGGTYDGRRKGRACSRPAGGDSTVGEPLAEGMMELLREEIVSGIAKRGITDRLCPLPKLCHRQAELVGRRPTRARS